VKLGFRITLRNAASAVSGWATDDYGMLRELFADPALAADKRYSDVLRGYLESLIYDEIDGLTFCNAASVFRAG
jgi:hypothetical protein